MLLATAATRTLGKSPGPRMDEPSWLTVRADVIAAVKLEIMMMAVNIQISPTTRPPIVRGALSP